MSDTQAKKLAEEIESYQLDLKTIEAACTTSEAAKKIYEYCQSVADPFLGENDGANPWQQSAQSGGGCLIL
uniref:Uncharacterized protein AlNc14C23G2356 n=1 Tax=Albugo laibachii Nc14 TaxID=890382 RepID=F0W657_9STRA|nr:hypothetical protein PITG_16898 [Albugo laibachii Nc14]|eukprot:CCA16599.1 hypothetical protein PITG_16898 [Albugo laibachii Nc14]